MSLLDENLDINPINLIITICKKHLFEKISNHYKEIININNIEISISKSVIKKNLIKNPQNYILSYRYKYNDNGKVLAGYILHENNINFNYMQFPTAGYINIGVILKLNNINHELV